MVLGPKQIHDAVAREEKKKMAEIEQLIDRELKNKYEIGRHVSVSLPTANSQPYDSGRSLPRQFLLDELMQKYRAAGWQRVELKQDQREGVWIEFHYKSRRRH